MMLKPKAEMRADVARDFPCEEAASGGDKNEQHKNGAYRPLLWKSILS